MPFMNRESYKSVLGAICVLGRIVVVMAAIDIVACKGTHPKQVIRYYIMSLNALYALYKHTRKSCV